MTKFICQQIFFLWQTVFSGKRSKRELSREDMVRSYKNGAL